MTWIAPSDNSGRLTCLTHLSRYYSLDNTSLIYIRRNKNKKLKAFTIKAWWYFKTNHPQMTVVLKEDNEDSTYRCRNVLIKNYGETYLLLKYI